ncbi:MAG: hypothetical protein ACK2UU_19085 [Anaerolineae bacterium]|jgi:hypothetical protein
MMDTREIKEILAIHADQLVSADTAATSGLSRHDRVQGLLDLAEQVQGILVPVEPEINFRRRLHGDLVLEAQRRQTEQPVNPLVQHRKGILIGAATLGSVASVLGLVIAFVLRYRHKGATNIAT